MPRVTIIRAHKESRGCTRRLCCHTDEKRKYAWNLNHIKKKKKKRSCWSVNSKGHMLSSLSVCPSECPSRGSCQRKAVVAGILISRAILRACNLSRSRPNLATIILPLSMHFNVTKPVYLQEISFFLENEF
jgi:hypothetical protein